MGRKLAASLVIILVAAPLVGCTASAQLGSPPQEPAPPAEPAPAPAPPAPVAPAAEPAAPVAVGNVSTVKQEGGKLKMPGAIVFQTGMATLLPESFPVLEQLKNFLEERKQITLVRIEGHTDNVGQPAANLKLSGERALAVRQWLIDHGTDAKRLISVGFGDLKPVADNKTEEGRSQNRRTEFVVVELGGRPYHGADATGGGTVFGTNPR